MWRKYGTHSKGHFGNILVEEGGEWVMREGFKGIKRGGGAGCDHTSTNAPDPIRTPKLSVLGRE